MTPDRSQALADFLYETLSLAQRRGLSYFEGRVAMLAAAELMSVIDQLAGMDADKSAALALAIVERSDHNLRKFPRIVCLCGASQYYAEMQEACFLETMAGRIVLTPGGQALGGNVGCTLDESLSLEELQRRKIELADEVLIVDAGGVIDERIGLEIEHAMRLGKLIRFWSRGEIGQLSANSRSASAVAVGAGSVR